MDHRSFLEYAGFFTLPAGDCLCVTIGRPFETGPIQATPSTAARGPAILSRRILITRSKGKR